MALRVMQGKVWLYLLVKPVLPVGIAFLSPAEHSLLYKPQYISADCLKLSRTKKQGVLQRFWVLYHHLPGQMHCKTV